MSAVDLANVILNNQGVEVSPMDLYTDMFHIGEGMIQKTGEYRGEIDSDFKGNPVGYFKNEREDTGHFRVFTEDNFQKTLRELQRADWSLLGGVTYFGRRPIQEHADKLFAFIFDMDEINVTNLINFFSGASVGYYPLPQYVVISKSGKGLHFYYLLEEPLSLFPNIRLQAKELKYALTDRIWNQYTSSQKKVEHQGIFQRFQVAGAKVSETKGYEVMRCFRLNTHPTSVEELMRYAPDVQLDKNKRFKESKMTLAEAKVKYPAWYDKVVLQKDYSVKKWDIKGKVHGSDPYALYHWWLKKIVDGASVGHRYFCIMTLVIMAVKNDYPYEKLKKDCMELIPFMNSINLEEPFTEKDVNSALECFDDRYCTFPNKDISKLSNIDIPKNKRNGRKQDVHMKIMSSTRDILYPDGEWRNKDGRPTQEQTVREWRQLHPEGKKIDCSRDTGLHINTVYKWWN